MSSPNDLRCNICDYKTTRSRYLAAHIRIHTGDMLKCDVCEFKTTHISDLRRHMREHTGDMLNVRFVNIELNELGI